MGATLRSLPVCVNTYIVTWNRGNRVPVPGFPGGVTRNARLLHLQNYFAELRAGFQVSVGGGGFA